MLTSESDVWVSPAGASHKQLMEETKEGFVFDEKKHLYFYDGKPMTGCTTILGILAKPALIPWAAKMATDHVRSELSKTDKWFGLPNFREFLMKQKAHTPANATTRPKAAPIYMRLLRLGCERVLLKMMAIRRLREEGPIFAFIEMGHQGKVRFIATETKLYSKELWVAGTVDLVFEKGGKRFVGDIKTYKKLWDRVPLIQCAGYALMAEEMKLYPHTFEDSTEAYGFDGYCVICLPKERAFNEAEDVMWSFDPQAEREAFISAVKLYRYLNQ